MEQNNTTDSGLTEAQRSEVLQLLNGYFGSEQAKKQAQDAAKSMMDWQFQDGMKAKLAALMEAEPQKLIAELFRNSGQIVQTTASKEFDAIIADVVKDEASGIPEAIRQHVKDNLNELIQTAITSIVASMVVDFLKGGSLGATDSTRALIRDAFMNASMSTRY